MKNTMNTKTKFTFSTLILLFLLAMLGTSCSKEDKEPIQEEDPFLPPSAVEFNSLREIALRQHTETALFNAEDGISFTSDDGATIRIPADCLTLDGNMVTGEVELTFSDIYQRRDMLPTNKPTMGLKPNGDKAMLITGGEFFIEVRKDGVLLDSGCTFQLRVPVDNTGGADPEMILWKGIIDENGNLTWEEIEPNGNARLFIENDFYTVFAGEFGWTNIDRFYSDPRDKTTMMVEVPEGFDDTNSAVYISYDGEPNALAQLDTFDEQSGIFSEHYGQIPIGLQVHLIFATAEGENWRYAIQGVTITENEVYTITLEETQVDTFENMVTAIDGLP